MGVMIMSLFDKIKSFLNRKNNNIENENVSDEKNSFAVEIDNEPKRRMYVSDGFHDEEYYNQQDYDNYDNYDYDNTSNRHSMSSWEKEAMREIERETEQEIMKIDERTDKLYSDLNFNLENVKYCDVLRNIIDGEFAMIESEQKFNETCAYVYEANRYLSEEEVFNEYADRFCKDAFAVDYNDDNLKISQTLLNNIKNPDLAGMLDSILANQDDYPNQLKDTIQHIDYSEFKDAIGHSTFKVIDEARNDIAVGVCHFDYVFPFNFKDYKVENEIKYMLRKFVQGCSNDDEELMNQSLTKAVMFANFCEKYSEKWINHNAERLLSDELTYNINSKLNNLDKNLLAELNHEID